MRVPFYGMSFFVREKLLPMILCLCIIVAFLTTITEKANALSPEESKWVNSGNPYGYNWTSADGNYEVACTTIAWQDFTEKHQTPVFMRVQGLEANEFTTDLLLTTEPLHDMKASNPTGLSAGLLVSH